MQVFLLGTGVEAQSLDTDKFKITEQMQTLRAAGGMILACGTCLKLRLCYCVVRLRSARGYREKSRNWQRKFSKISRS